MIFKIAHRLGHGNSSKIYLLRLAIASIIFLFPSTGAVKAATYYLDAINGDDGNPGTSSAPWKTIARAMVNYSASETPKVLRGDTVIIRNGQYSSFTLGPSDLPDYTGNINDPLPGDTLWTSYRAADGHTVTFDYILFDGGNPHIIAHEFDGIDITRTHGNSVNVRDGGMGVRLKNMTLTGGTDIDWLRSHGQWGSVVHLTSTNHGIGDITIENCNISHGNDGISAMGWQSNLRIRGCKVHHNRADKIYMGGGKNVLIENNDFYGNPLDPDSHGDILQVYTAGGTLTNLVYRNNKMHDHDCQGFWTGGSHLRNCLFENNLMYNIGNYEWRMYNIEDSTIRNNTIIGGGFYQGVIVYGSGNEFPYGPCSNLTIANNIFAIPYMGDSNVMAYHNHNIYVTGRPSSPGQSEPDSYEYSTIQEAVAALFVDPDNDDYRLKDGSLAIGFANPSYANENDILGNPRDAQPDAGCYEYLSSSVDTTAPTIPQNLVATAVNESRIDLTWQASTDSESGVDHYKVYRDDVLVDPSTSISYSDTSLSTATTYTYKVSAVNGAGLESNRSASDSATTLADTTPPEIISANTVSSTFIKVVFSEPLDTTSAENVVNYAINKGISISAASLDVDLTTVTLTSSAHTDGVTYTLTIADVQDATGNPMIETSIEYTYVDGLVGYWKFDDGSGTTTQDSSGNGNTATLVNGPTWTAGKINGGLSFDGIDDAVQVSTANLSASSGTIVLWSNAASFSSDTPQYLFGHATQPWSNRIQLYTDDAEGYLDLGLGDSHTRHTNIADLDTNRWYHIALSWDGTNYVVYVDGTSKASGTYTGLSSLETYADIGNDGYSSERTEAFNGIIDEVRVYNRALTANEVLTLYNNEAGSTNQAPVLSSIGNKSVNENEALTFAVTATDADGDAVTYSAQNLPSGATFANQNFSWTPGYNQAGSYQVTFIASDGQAQDSEIATITVNNVNRAPVLQSIGNKSVDENSTLSFSVSVSDADSDTITYSVQSLPSGATFASPFTWTPDYTQAGTYQVTFTASDGQAQDSETITITVNNVNRAPVLSSIGDKSIYANGSLTFTVDATDPDGDNVECSATGLPSGATFANQTFSWTPGQSQVASYDVTFVASDGQLQDSEQITIVVNSTDTSPPSVTNYSPTADSIQVPLNSLVTLHIVDVGEGVDTNSVIIKVSNKTVYSGNTAHYNSTYGDCRRTGTKADYKFTYQPNKDFKFDRTITITVSASDLAGNAMDEYSYSFKTEMRSFGQNKKVSSGISNLGEGVPATLADSSGNIWTAWHAGSAGSRDIYVGKLTAGAGNFSSSVQLTNSAADQCSPALAIGGDDKLYVVWQDNRRGNWDIYLSSSSDRTNWSTATRVTDSNDNEINPSISIDNQSPHRAYITWQDDRSGNHDIYVASSNNNFATKITSRITSDSSNQIRPDIAVDSDNTIYVVWTDERNSSNDIYGAASNSGPWTNVPIVTNTSNQSSPAIATESAGSILHLLWVDDTPGNKDIYYVSSNGLPASPLTGSSIIDDSSGANQMEPVIAVTGSSGNNLSVFACWQDWRNVAGGSTDTDLYFAEISSDSGTNVLVGDDSTNANQNEPAIGVDAYGHPYLVWTDSRNSTAEIYYAGSTFLASTALASKNVSPSLDTIVGTKLEVINSVEDVSVTVPAGAYPCDIEITISEIINPQAFAVECLAAYDFGPSGTEFNQPVTITIPYVFSGSDGSATPYWFNALSGALSQQGITGIEDIVISSTLHALQFKTTHFTPFYLLLGGGASAGAAAGGGGGGGGGCALSANGEGNIVEFLLPYVGLALVIAVVKLRDTRNRRAYHYEK